MKKMTIKGCKSELPVLIFEDQYEIGSYLAEFIISKIVKANSENKFFLIGCPSGRSLQSTYDKLGEVASKSGADFSKVIFVMMDEYVIDENDKFDNCLQNSHYSCFSYAQKEILSNINNYLPEEKKIKKENIWFPDVLHPDNYEKKILSIGGVDIFLAASGATDGHVAFNPPYTKIDSNTRIVKLAEETRIDNMDTFPGFKNLKEVPKYGISVGLGTIVKYSKQVVMVIHGENKKASVNKVMELKKFAEEWPASFIYKCNGAILICDKSSFK